MNILNKFKILFLTTIVLMVVGANADSYYKNKITISGSEVFDNEIFDKEYKIESKTGLMIYVKNNSSVEGIKDLLGGRADLAMTSSSLSSLSPKMKDVDISKLKEFEITQVELGFLVNPRNKVGKLSIDQIKKIYTGKITNWKEVGGDDIKILILSRGKNNPTEEILGKILGIEYTAKNIKDNLSTRKLSKMINNTIGSIALYPMDFLLSKDLVKYIKIDQTLKQKLYLVTKGEPNSDAKKIIDAAREVSKD